MAARRTVVLGANGFIARGLIEFLAAAGRPCRAVGSGEVDLTDASAAEKLCAIFQPEDAVVICSALTPEKGRDRATFLKNVHMAVQVAAALETAPCAQVVSISSDSVSSPGGDFYALAHLVREQMMQAVCAAGGIALTILRPGAVFGTGDTHNAYGPNRFLRSALQARKISLFGEGEELRDHLYIRDLSRIIQLSIEHGTTGILNAATGPMRFREIADTIARVLGGGIAIESLPRAVPVVHRHADTAPLFAAFPEFRATPFEDAIREMIATPRAAVQ